MFCPKCGKQLDDADVFCRFCGQSLSLSRPTLPAPQTTGISTAKIAIGACLGILGAVAIYFLLSAINSDNGWIIICMILAVLALLIVLRVIKIK